MTEQEKIIRAFECMYNSAEKEEQNRQKELDNLLC